MANKEDLEINESIIQNNDSGKENISTAEVAFNTSSLPGDEDLQVYKKNPLKDQQLIVEEYQATTNKKSLSKPSIYFEDVANSIESAFPINRPLEQTAFPHPRNWLGPRFMAVWTLPIIAINKTRFFLTSSNPVKPYQDTHNKLTKAETIFTATQKVFKGSNSIRFFGPLFLSIWVLPLALTGTAMEILFVGPLKGTSPFG
ncbi:MULTISPECIES: hypothetical protein [Prochlorococcus]|uniref:hypothetical protein n=1 Tax=Prochlorococcus TaxID=1218 RepID=UPI000533B719|nr:MULTISPECIES: hypothetical protein [Prochlorococcus]KGG14171.1 hypothetical protein EV05_0060 [Prochlorococcus sp. MIT 0601]